MRLVSPVSLAFVGAFAWLAGCAQGSEIGASGGSGGQGGGEVDGSGKTSSQTTNAATSGHSTTAGVTTAAQSSSGSDVGGAGGGGPTCDFTVDNSCAMAQGLPSVSGDNGGSEMATGVGSHWLQVHFTEDNSAIFSTKDLGYTITLTNPPGMVYNLYVHEGSDGNGTDCGAAVKTGTPDNAPSQMVHDHWDDTQGIGGEDNSRWVSIEVRFIGGTDCTTPWSLQIVGGT